MNAAFTLGDMKLPEARQMLEQATLDPNLIVRNQAIIALAKLGDKKAVPALQQAIKQNTGEQRWLAMLALLYITEGEYREPFVSAVLTSDDHQLRLQSALALASFGEQRVMPYLFYMMRSSTYSRIWNAAKQLKTPMLHQLTLSWLRANINMPVYIQPALDFLGREEATNLKSDLLTLLFTRWYRPDFRPRNISNTVDILDYKGEPIKPWGDYLYVNALQHVIKFLGYSGDAELKPWLKYFIYHVNYHVRSEAQLALARLKDDKVLGDLIEQLRISSEHHRPYLVSLLSDLPNQQLAPKLMPLLDHKDPYLRLAVSVILVSAGSEQALPILLQAFRSPQASMRSRARFYVMQHQTPELARALNSAAKTEKNPTASELLQRITAAMQPSNPNFLLFNVQRVYMR
jgi:HEAT repeat protein